MLLKRNDMMQYFVVVVRCLLSQMFWLLLYVVLLDCVISLFVCMISLFGKVKWVALASGFLHLEPEGE